MKKLFVLSIFLFTSLLLLPQPTAAFEFGIGALIKLPDDGNNQTQPDSTVYYYGSDGRRHVFQNERTYFSWYENFDEVQIVDAETLASIPLGRNIYSKPGVYMVKLEADPKVYGVAKGGVLREMITAEIADELYSDELKGERWQDFVLDVPAGFWINYTSGGDIVDKPIAFNPGGEEFVAKSISFDMDLVNSTPETL